MSNLTPAERSLRARLAAHALHASHDSQRLTEKARSAFLMKFEMQVDPDGILLPEERARRADHAKKAHMLRLALKSAEVRKRHKRAKP